MLSIHFPSKFALPTRQQLSAKSSLFASRLEPFRSYVTHTKSLKLSGFPSCGLRHKRVHAVLADRRDNSNQGQKPRSARKSRRGSKRVSTKIPDNKPKFDFVRVFEVVVSVDNDPGKDYIGVSEALVASLQKKLKIQVPENAIQVVRKSMDARKKLPCWNYVVDVNCTVLPPAAKRRIRLKDGQVIVAPTQTTEVSTSSIPLDSPPGAAQAGGRDVPQERVVVVGSGPAGLFCALTLAQRGVAVTLVEKGKAVEDRGRDIGALFSGRRILNPNSNLCYGEGGAGTWSDGKLVTRIGKNSQPVRQVLESLVEFGAPERILSDGKPHVGTDRLVLVLRTLRQRLIDLNVDIMFSSSVKELLVTDNSAPGEPGSRVVGVSLSDGTELSASHVVLAVGHSARDMYEHLVHLGVKLTPKDFALGFRVEHPQEFINSAQYGDDYSQLVQRGKGLLPVADYRLAVEVTDEIEKASTSAPGGKEVEEKTPVFSFCMCPGGQVVPTSTNEDELCINGMSFSKRGSVWANSALVVGVQSGSVAELAEDWEDITLPPGHEALLGVQFQRCAERRAAVMGGGNLVAPVQTVEDFMNGRLSPEETLPTSSYRLGVKSARLDTLYPEPITRALRKALLSFDKRLPGFISQQGLLHGVETRTSAPVCIERSAEVSESVSMSGLYPCGEGAGYAGGIVSSAVDGIFVGESILARILSEA